MSRNETEIKAALRAVEDMERTGVTAAVAIRRLRLKPATFYRWAAREKAGTLGAPRRKGHRPPFFARPGYEGRLAPGGFVLLAAEVECLRWFSETHESAEFGVKRFAWYARREMLTGPDGDPLCPHEPAREEVRAAILTKMAAASGKRRCHFAMSLMRLARTTTADGAQRRGGKAALNSTTAVPRGDFWKDEAGRTLPLLPGCGFVSDDMSINQPFRYQDADGAWRTGRQMLCTMDVASLAWLGANQVGRIKDAYRVEDIAEHMEAMVTQHGWPAWWSIERGPWDNNFIWGTEVPSEWGEADGFTWGGLTMFTRISPKFTPRGKTEIEQGFNRLQKWLAGGSVDIGRRRGEFEQATKIHKAAADGSEAALARLWTVYQAAEAVAEAMHGDSETDHARTAFNGRRITPAAWWQEAAAGVTSPLKASERWVFSPLKLALTARKDGTVRHTRGGVGYVFNVSGVFRGLQELDHGHRLFVAFHPDHLERGCHVFNAERASVRNRDGLRHGEFLGVAPLIERVAAADFSGGGDYTAKKTRAAAMRGELRAIVPGRRGAGLAVATIKDNAGRHVSREHGQGNDEGRSQNDEPGRRDTAPVLPAQARRGGVAELLRARRAVTPAAVPVAADGEEIEVHY